MICHDTLHSRMRCLDDARRPKDYTSPAERNMAIKADDNDEALLPTMKEWYRKQRGLSVGEGA